MPIELPSVLNVLVCSLQSCVAPLVLRLLLLLNLLIIILIILLIINIRTVILLII